MNLTPKEAADRLHITTGTLSNWRVRGNGPRYIKFGNKILYPVQELEDFERKSIRSSTADDPNMRKN